MFLPCILILCPPPAYRLLPYKFSCFTHGIPHTTPRTTQRRNDLKSVLPAFENSTQSHLHQTQSQSQKPCHRSITSTSSPDPSMIQVLVFPSASQQSNTEPPGNRSPLKYFNCCLLFACSRLREIPRRDRHVLLTNNIRSYYSTTRSCQERSGALAHKAHFLEFSWRFANPIWDPSAKSYREKTSKEDLLRGTIQ